MPSALEDVPSLNCIASLPNNLIVGGDAKGRLCGFDASALFNNFRVAANNFSSPLYVEQPTTSGITNILTRENGSRILVGCENGLIAMVDAEQPAKVIFEKIFYARLGNFR